MRTTLMLCDAAEASNGKLFIMGGGWSVLNAADSPVTMALAVLIAVPWDEGNASHRVEVSLYTFDGERVEIEGQEVIAIREFELGRPAGLKPGTELDAPMVFRFDGVVLAAGGYRWELHVNGEQTAIAPFRVQPAV